MSLLKFPEQRPPSGRGIDICSVCHFSRYTDELRAEWIPMSNPVFTEEFPFELVLTCRQCEATPKVTPK